MRRLVVLLAFLTAAVAAPTASAVALPSVLGQLWRPAAARPSCAGSIRLSTRLPRTAISSPTERGASTAGRASLPATSRSPWEARPTAGRWHCLPAARRRRAGCASVWSTRPYDSSSATTGRAFDAPVDVMFRDVFGVVRALPVSVVANGRSWRPTLPIVYLANVPTSLLPLGGPSAVAFRFVPQSSGGQLADRRRVRRSVQGPLSPSTAGSSDSVSIVTAPSEATSRPRVTSTASASPAACAPVMS